MYRLQQPDFAAAAAAARRHSLEGNSVRVASAYSEAAKCDYLATVPARLHVHAGCDSTRQRPRRTGISPDLSLLSGL